jgi:hypothetical protein
VVVAVAEAGGGRVVERDPGGALDRDNSVAFWRRVRVLPFEGARESPPIEGEGFRPPPPLPRFGSFPPTPRMTETSRARLRLRQVLRALAVGAL